jgi:hypothetical protein
MRSRALSGAPGLVGRVGRVQVAGLLAADEAGVLRAWHLRRGATRVARVASLAETQAVQDRGIVVGCGHG